MAKGISTLQFLSRAKPGDTYLSNNGVEVKVVSVKVGDVNETRYQRSYPPNSAPVTKALFGELFTHKTFTPVAASPSSGKEGGK